MAFKDELKKLNAHRLQQSVKATVQVNGRLTFTVEATKEMALSEEKSLIIFEANGGNLGAVISHKGDPDAFVLKKCGQYFYVAFKNYLQQAGIDYKGQRIIYDITELDEELEGKTLYKFERRVLPKAPEQLPYSDATDGSGDGEGSGSGAGNEEVSGSDEPSDDVFPPEPPETAQEPDEAPPLPPARPALPTRPAPSTPLPARAQMPMPRRPAPPPVEAPPPPPPAEDDNGLGDMPF